MINIIGVNRSDCEDSLLLRTMRKRNIPQVLQDSNRCCYPDRASFMLRKPHCDSSSRFGFCHRWM